MGEGLAACVSTIFWQDHITYAEPSAPAVAFLAKHTDIRELIKESLPELRRIFGESVQVELEAGRCYQSEGMELWATVCYPGSVESGLEKMERFDHEWWLARLNDKIGFTIRASCE